LTLLGYGREDAGLELTVVRREVEVALRGADLTKARGVSGFQEVFEINRVPDKPVEVVSDDTRYPSIANVLKKAAVRRAATSLIRRRVVVLVDLRVVTDERLTVSELSFDTNPLTLGVMRDPHVDRCCTSCCHECICTPRRDATYKQTHDRRKDKRPPR
jgi:hypothetical protein